MKFSISYLKRPNITYRNEEEADFVSLLCVVPIDKRVSHWRNVTYQIEWHSEGELLHLEKPFCLPPDGAAENTNACPGDTEEIRSKLEQRMYERGQWVR